MKRLTVLVVCALPASTFKNWLLRQLGFRVSRTARFAPCLVLNVSAILLADRARIGPFNVFRDLSSLDLAEQAVIGQWNWVSAARPLVTAPGQGTLRIGRESALTSRHYVDASGGVSIGDFTTVAGVRSTFITHGIDWRSNRQSTRPISIGNYCLVSSNVALPPGATIPDRSLVGMGATIVGGDEEGMLWVGSRALAVKPISGDYFTRLRGFVDPPDSRPYSEGDRHSATSRSQDAGV